MSRQTTAIVLVGEKADGPWGDELLRPTHVVRFTENSVPGWQVHPLNGASGVKDEPTARGTAAALHGSTSLAHELVVLIATEVLRDTRTLAHPAVAGAQRTTADGGGLAIPERGFPDEAVESAVAAVAANIRLWILPLSPHCLLLADTAVEDLRRWGVETDLRSVQAAVSEPRR